MIDMSILLAEAHCRFPYLILLRDEQLNELLRLADRPASELKQMSQLSDLLRSCTGADDLELDGNEQVIGLRFNSGALISLRGADIVPTRGYHLLDWLAALQLAVPATMEASFHEAWKRSRDASVSELATALPQSTALLVRRVRFHDAVEKVFAVGGSVSSVAAALAQLHDTLAEEVAQTCAYLQTNPPEYARIRADALLTLLQSHRAQLQLLERPFAHSSSAGGAGSRAGAIDESRRIWARLLKHAITPSGRVVARCGAVELAQRFHGVYEQSYLIETPLTWSAYHTAMDVLDPAKGEGTMKICGPPGSGKTETALLFACVLGFLTVNARCDPSVPLTTLLRNLHLQAADARFAVVVDDFDKLGRSAIATVGALLAAQSSRRRGVGVFTACTFTPPCPDAVALTRFPTVHFAVPPLATLLAIPLLRSGIRPDYKDIPGCEAAADAIEQHINWASERLSSPLFSSSMGMLIMLASVVGRQYRARVNGGTQHADVDLLQLVRRTSFDFFASHMTGDDARAVQAELGMDEINLPLAPALCIDEETAQTLARAVERAASAVVSKASGDGAMSTHLAHLLKRLAAHHAVVCLTSEPQILLEALRTLTSELRQCTCLPPGERPRLSLIRTSGCSGEDFYGMYTAGDGNEPEQRSWRRGLLHNALCAAHAHAGTTWIVLEGTFEEALMQHARSLLSNEKVLRLANGEVVPMGERTKFLFVTRHLRYAGKSNTGRLSCKVYFDSANVLSPAPLSHVKKLNLAGSMRDMTMDEAMSSMETASTRAPAAVGVFPIHEAAALAKWDEVCRLAAESVKLGGASLSVLDGDGRLPIHWAALHAHWPTVYLLADALPESLNRPNARGELCLHLAAHASAWSTVGVLAHRWPPSVACEDEDGLLPIHIVASACERDEAVCPLLEELAAASPRSLTVFDPHTERIALHCAVNGQRWATASKLATLCPESVALRDHEWTALHRVASHLCHAAIAGHTVDTVGWDLFEVLADLHPPALRELDPDQQLLGHHIARARQPAILDTLIASHPSCVEVRIGGRRPHELVDVSESVTARFVLLARMGREARARRYTECETHWRCCVATEWEPLAAAFATCFAVEPLEALNVCASLVRHCQTVAHRAMELDEHQGQRVLLRSQLLQQAAVALLGTLHEAEQAALFASAEGTEALREMVRAEAYLVLGTGRVQRMLVERWWHNPEPADAAFTSADGADDDEDDKRPNMRAAQSSTAARVLLSYLVLSAALAFNLALVLPLVALFPPLEKLIARQWEAARADALKGVGIPGFFSYADGGRFVDGSYYRDEAAFGAALQQYAGRADHKIRQWFPLLQPRAKFFAATLSTLGLAATLTWRAGRRDSDVESDFALTLTLTLWALVALFGEVAEMCTCMQDWLGEPLNVLELSGYVLVCVSLGTPLLADNFDLLGEFGLLDELYWLERGNVLLGGGTAMLWLSQGLRLYLRDSLLGPLVSMMIRMVRDVSRWLLLLLPVLVAFATWLFMMFVSADGGERAFDDTATADECAVFADADMSLRSITLALAEIPLGGDSHLSCLHASAFYVTAPGVMLAFLLATMILMLNMLIAMMAKSFDSVWEQQALNYQHLNAQLVLEYEARAAPPTPLTLLSLPYRLLAVIAPRPRLPTHSDHRKAGFDRLVESPDEAGAGSRGGLSAPADGAGGAYSRRKTQLRTFGLAIDAYIQENASEQTSEDSWKKKLGRDLGQWARKADARLVRLAEDGGVRVGAVEARVEALALEVRRMAQAVESERQLRSNTWWYQTTPR